MELDMSVQVLGLIEVTRLIGVLVKSKNLQTTKLLVWFNLNPGSFICFNLIVICTLLKMCSCRCLCVSMSVDIYILYVW